MFGLFKKDGMSNALDECQAYHIRLGLDQEMTQKQLVTIKAFDLFMDIENRHKSKGLTKYGGLAWFCAQSLINTAKTIDDGTKVSPLAMEYMQKLIYVSLAIGNSIPELKLTKADMGPIQNACEAAMEWMKRNPHPLDAELSALMAR